MKQMETEKAVGQVLCHDITQIIRGEIKDARFRKGHVITEEDIPILLSLGKNNVYIWENINDMLHENDAAEVLCELCRGENMSPTPPKEGKIELIADIDGLLLVDTGRLRAVNELGEMMIATRASGIHVKKGDKLCGTRVIPLVIEKEKMENARKVAGNDPLLSLLPIKPKKYGLITTGNEVFHGYIKDTFSPVINDKMSEYGCVMAAHQILGDDHAKITAAINEMLAQGAKIVSYGAPVLPGAMFLIAYTIDGKPICGLPGCVMYGRRTIFDLVLPRLLADVPVYANWLAGLGNGGL